MKSEDMGVVRWLHLPLLSDDRGSLVAIESNKIIPFDIKRVYFIFGTKPDSPRGFHAHKALRQVAVCVHGSCRILLDNRAEKSEVWLESPNKGLIIDNLVWHEMHDFSSDCVLLMLASEHYDKDDYIRNYDEFAEKVKA